MTTSLSNLGAGFVNEALGSQHVFSSVLEALSHPGRPVEVVHDAETPSFGNGAAAAALLALLDSDCSLWLSPRLAASDTGQWLRFHTGCSLVDDATEARFVWIAQGDAIPELTAMRQGSDIYPDQSATCLIDVDAVSVGETDDGWNLTGPGINGVRRLRVDGLPESFTVAWVRNHSVFPRGVDVLIATGTQITGLPRTTRIATNTRN